MSSTESRNETLISTPSDTEIRIERTFDAPRELVWECHTDPEVLSDWMGPRRLKLRVDRYDFEAGGAWRFTHIDPDGQEYEFFGDFLEVKEPEHIVQTFNFVMDPQPPASVERIEFEELDGERTRIVTVTKFESREQRDGMIQSGMESGVVEGYERLDELLERRGG